MTFTTVSGKAHTIYVWDESEPICTVDRYNPCPLADRMEVGRITYCSMHACVRKVEWLSMEDKVPPDRREFKPVEIPPATFEAGSPRIHSWEEVTSRNLSECPGDRDIVEPGETNWEYCQSLFPAE